MEEPSGYVLLLENWIPGIGESTDLHDELHIYFKLGFSIKDEAKLLGFQLGHHPLSNIFHVIAFTLLSTTIYPNDYRNSLADIRVFYRSYRIGKYFQGISYWYIPSNILDKI